MKATILPKIEFDLLKITINAKIIKIKVPAGKTGGVLQNISHRITKKPKLKSSSFKNFQIPGKSFYFHRSIWSAANDKVLSKRNKTECVSIWS